MDLNGAVTVTGRPLERGNGTFTPNAGALNANYVPTAAEIAAGSVTPHPYHGGQRYLQRGQRCHDAHDHPAPVVDAGAR